MRFAPSASFSVIGLLLLSPFSAAATPAAARTNGAAAAVPLFFVPNEGQADPRVRFQSFGAGGSLSFEESGIVVVAPAGPPDRTPHSAPRLDVRSDDSAPRVAVHQLRFEGSSAKARIVGVERLPGKVNVFRGADPNRWRRSLPIYAGIAYRGLYPGVDLELGFEGGQIRGRFVLAEGADASGVRWRWDGGEMKRPDAAEPGAGLPVLSFSPLQRSPAAVLAAGTAFYSTYFGGSGEDIGFALAVDADSAAYLTGTTLSADLPTKGPIDSTCGDDAFCDSGLSRDAFVAKIDPNQTGASSLVYATYLGGSGEDDGVRIAVDASKRAYVVGLAHDGFPTTSNAYQTAFPSTDPLAAAAFLAKLSADGSELLYSTYLGGSSGAWGVAIDGSGGAWLAGRTISGDFPATTGAFDTICGTDGACDCDASDPKCEHGGDAFVARLDTTLAGVDSLTFATFLGGSGEENAFGIALGAGNTIHVVGRTASTDFPHPGGFQTTYGGGIDDAFVAKFSAGASSLLYATYLGGNGYDDAYTVAVDASGRDLLTGTTASTNFPTTAGARQTSYGGGPFDAYFARVDPSKTGSDSLTHATYLGGSDDDDGFGLVRDGDAVWLTGYTLSSDFPVAGCPPRASSAGAYDAFLSRIDPALSGSASLTSSGYFGGSSTDTGYDVARDGLGNLFLTGQTLSFDFPTENAFDASHVANSDAFLTRLTVLDCAASHFFTVAPCRVLDTRAAAGPALAAGTSRSFEIAGACGVPAIARAVSANVTVTQPTAMGDLRLYPAGTPRPAVSTINYRPGQTRANNFVLSLGSAGDLAVRCDQASGTVHLILDVFGYFE